MNVLWFEVTTPQRYKDNGIVYGGWQDSLERVVTTCPDINLAISFIGERNNVGVKRVGNVEYIPMNLDFSLWEKVCNKLTSEIEIAHLMKQMLKVIEQVQPDLIQVFGTEWPFGHIAKFTNIPVVVHIMGAMIPYMNAQFPPLFSYRDIWTSFNFLKPKECIEGICNHIKEKKVTKHELEIWKHVKFYMGRTKWDYALSNILHPNRMYFHVNEALRVSFLSGKDKWKGANNQKILLISTGCSSFWKGPDMLLKVAKILRDLGVNFEWKVAGYMSNILKNAVEKKLKTTFEENNIRFLGFTKPDDLTKILCESTMYVHTAYIENSPNSVCEAQCLGVPIISTNVGGISSLVEDGKQGILVPANDPWQMANSIIELSNDKKKMLSFSEENMKCALIRHNDENIKNDLLNCYKTILNI